MMAKKRKSIADGKTENKNYMRCPQTQCSYYRDGGCKACSTCKTEPYVIKKSCPDCVACHSEPGFLRWDAGKKKQEIKLPEGVNEEEFLLTLLKAAIDKRLDHIGQDKQPKEPEVIIER